MWILCIALAIVLWIPFHIKYGGKSCKKNPDWLWILIAFTIPCIVGCDNSLESIDTGNYWYDPDAFWDDPDLNYLSYKECYMINGDQFIFGCWHDELETKDIRGWDEWHGKPPIRQWVDDNKRNAKNPDGTYKYADGLSMEWMPPDENLDEVYLQYKVVYPDPNYPDDAAKRRVKQQQEVMDLVGHYSKPRKPKEFIIHKQKASRDSKEYGPFGSSNDSIYFGTNGWFGKNWDFVRRDAAQCGWINGDSYISGCWHDERGESTLAWDEWPGEAPSYDWFVENRKNKRLLDGSLMYPNGVEKRGSGEWIMPTVKSRSENRSNHVATEW